ncbi:MAG: RluA family pseudouridine synthase [Puniceicoccaceae bacterium]
MSPRKTHLTLPSLEALPWHSGIRIVAHNQNYLGITKPIGVLSHPNQPDDPLEAGRSLLASDWDPQSEAFAINDRDALYLCHRIDAPTSGSLLLATNEAAARFARDAFAKGLVSKTYHAIVRGTIHLQETQWRDRLARRPTGKTLRMQVLREGVTAVTRVKSLRSTRRPQPLTLLEFQPLTGRTHQLRIQSTERGYPILGDKTYGDFAFNRNYLRLTSGEDRLHLHATCLRLTQADGKEFEVLSPLPQNWPLTIDFP